MYYYRRIWGWILVFQLAVWMVTKWIFDEHIPWLEQYGYRFHYFSMMYRLSFIVTVIFLTIWMIMDWVTGTLHYDIKSAQLCKYLCRVVNDGVILQLSGYEEFAANKKLKWLRIKYKRKKDGQNLMLIIPCGNSGSVRQVIEDRCKKYKVEDWLHKNFSETHWKPLKTIFFSTGTRIVFEQK